MNSDAVRQKFIEYFLERGHLQLPSLPLVPGDSGVTTLFTIAGMQQLIPYFLGREAPPSRRLVSVQKSIRTVDIEEVGDYKHLTFLEMLGNFSVGDYFKQEAIAFTWDFLTQVMGIPAEKWWATTYPGDEEAREAWLAVGMPAERIGETEENWWEQGPVGPCGPDSEIHYDRGLQYSCGRSDCRPETECCERFVETWNNVFMVYYQDELGKRSLLPQKNIDTGMGFERLVTVVQGAETPYHTDLFEPLFRTLETLSGKNHGEDEKIDQSLRIIADHSRAISFIIADGVMPSAEGRGYVLRRLIRRAALRGRLIGIGEPFLTHCAQAVIDKLGGYWTELLDRQDHILQVIRLEEARFLQTLTRGLGIFDDVAERASHDGNVISGKDAFVLYDTHGFPLEMTVELAEERGLLVDREGFEEELKAQQERGRKGQTFTQEVETSPETYAALAEGNSPTVFTGYDELQTASEIVGIFAGGKPVNRAEAGDEVELVLAATPFYAEAGGQVGDTGVIRSDSGAARVLDTQRPHASLVVHKTRVEEGSLSVGDVVEAEVDAERRLHILPHHSGTHLLHKALHEVLGGEATQAGSLVAPDRLRFDFRWPRPLTPEELREVQDRVNAAIWANLPVRKEIMSYDEAIREGAVALFGEKYGERVRMVSMGEWSKELCGGTHVDATGDIGLLVITSEIGIGSGIRRVEALAGAAAYAYVSELREQVGSVAEVLETKPENIVPKARQLISELRAEQKRSEALTQKLAAGEAEALLRQGTAVDGVMVIANRIAADSVEYLQAATDAVKSRLKQPGAVVLATVVEGRPAFTMAVTRELRDAGFSANAILREAARHAEGGAGGNADFAQGGGRDASKVEDVLASAVELIRRKSES